ncbi:MULTISPECIES: Z1 domain-containing protein [Clostridium]|uniref:Z1 domain-containing protein n=1 Tax=Clostridium lapidicellarium TaxID=3240931 RepID=A0ABV4DY49_9CLOT|nr:Z1 domain-containing protein [uncultured Clostridium sp.]
MKTDGKFYSYKKAEGTGYNEELKKCIEDTCKYCIDDTWLDSQEKINKPIMMLGKIQSGKTRAFIGVISLAFDNSFDMVFILTKNSRALIQQTISRMKKEFKSFIDEYEVVVTDIMKANTRISGYQLEQKNIIVAKKEKNNIDRLIEFINNYSINENKKCLIIDDEADTTGIGYNKIKGVDKFTLRTVSSKVNEMRGTLDGCVFIEVTATPYALYLQPDFDETSPLQPIKPLKTVLVPHGKGYIGGEYYFIDSRDETHPASLLFEPISQDEGDIVSDQKRKGKKSKIEDRRTFKEEEILIREDKLTVFKKGIVNFIIGAIVLRKLYKKKDHYAYVIHTATQKNSHVNLQNVAEIFIQQIKNRSKDVLTIIEKLVRESFKDISSSVTAYGYTMPDYSFIRNEFYSYIDRGYYSINVVNADQDVDILLNEETGELNLTTPCSIFVGGQVLDRGVTIPNMIGFYYGRNPKTMQQDTVLQHSRMFGYRKALLPVTRFYTTSRIHSNMEKITEIDSVLREDIKEGKQGNGVYFITKKYQDNVYGVGGIRPCSPAKIRISDIILLESQKRILPIGFTPKIKTISVGCNNTMKKYLKDFNISEKSDGVMVSIKNAEKLINIAYSAIDKDVDDSRFIPEDEFLMILRYMADNSKNIPVIVRTKRTLSKYKKHGGIKTLSDSPDTPAPLDIAKELAINVPVLMLIQETENAEGWGHRPFWWPVIVAPENIAKTIYAAKVAGEKISI